CEELNILIAGDQLLPRISSNVSVFPTEPDADPLSDWLNSCTKLMREVDENALILPAHNEPFYGAHLRLQALIDGHEKSLERLTSRLEEPKRVVDLFTTLFARKIELDVLSMATGETLAHLNCLIERGQVVCETVDGVSRYSRVP
ncbi:MAG: MBL fold metallo-hydrolase, partial [Pseudomonadota bacterium]